MLDRVTTSARRFRLLYTYVAYDDAVSSGSTFHNQWSGIDQTRLDGRRENSDRARAVTSPISATPRTCSIALRYPRPNDRPPLIGSIRSARMPEAGRNHCGANRQVIEEPAESRLFLFEPRDCSGTAANNGQIIAEIAANHRTTEDAFADGSAADGPCRTSLGKSLLSPILKYLAEKKILRR